VIKIVIEYYLLEIKYFFKILTLTIYWKNNSWKSI